MKVSIVTVVYNDVRLSRAIDSVLAQKVDCEVELIVVSDETGEELDAVLREYDERVTVIKNDTRQGMYRARNQGIAASSGDIVGFLNADDHYHDDEVLADAVRAFSSREDIDLLSGNWKYVTLAGEVRDYVYQEKELASHNWLVDGMPFTDTALFHRRGVFERFGDYEVSFQIAGDKDLMIRMSLGGVSYMHLDRFMTVFYGGGISSGSNAWMSLKLLCENRRAYLRNGLPWVSVTFHMLLMMAMYLAAKCIPNRVKQLLRVSVRRLIRRIVGNMYHWESRTE